MTCLVPGGIEVGRSLPPGSERDAGPTPVSGATPPPHPALPFHCASCAACAGLPVAPGYGFHTRSPTNSARWTPSSAAIISAAFSQHRGGNAQLASDLAQRPTAAHQQGYRFLLELIRKMTPSLAHSTPFRSRRSLAKVSTNSGASALGGA